MPVAEVLQGVSYGRYAVLVSCLKLIDSAVLLFAALEGWGLEDSDGVQQFALAKRVLHEVAVRAEVDNHVFEVCCWACSGVMGRCRGMQRKRTETGSSWATSSAQRGFEPVGAHHDVRFVYHAIGGIGPRPIAYGLDPSRS
jgi:hypothetical protein